jgi:RNA-directed DNA polymerase
LTLHPDKTRLIEFGRFAAANRERRGLSKPETFKFLGFIFICGRKPPLREAEGDQGRPAKARPHAVASARVVQGWFNYHAVPTNFRVLSAFRFNVVDLWRRSLRRRSQKDVTTWERIHEYRNDRRNECEAAGLSRPKITQELHVEAVADKRTEEEEKEPTQGGGPTSERG